MTAEAISPTPKRMVRESIGVKGFYVWLFPAQMERIKALAGDQKASEFIREAIDRELKRRERHR